MSEPKKLTDQELMASREYQEQAINHLQGLAVGERFRTSIPAQDSDSDVVIGNGLHSMTSLFNHIDAIAQSAAEHEAAMTRAREDADRVGAARIEFEGEQQKRIEALEAELERLGGYSAFLRSCALSGEQPETYEWYLNRNNTD